MNIDELTLGDVKELQCMMGGKSSGDHMSLSGKKIMVLQRGWIVIGDVSQCGPTVTISDASVIRRWGTEKGLGEIAEGGPTSETRLDPIGTIQVHQLAVVMAVDVEAKKWK